MEDTPFDAEEVLAALGGPADVYQREAVQLAMDHPREVVPLLLSFLEDVLRDPGRVVATESFTFLPIYAVVLLGHHRERKAHRLLVDLLSLPGETPFDVFSDLVTEGVGAALWQTCGGDVAVIRELIENPEANEYCRSAAIEALTYGVAEGVLAREEVVSYLEGLYSLEEATHGGGFVFDAAAVALHDLWPGDSKDVLQRAFDDGVICPYSIDLSDLEAANAEGKDALLEALRRKAARALGQTPHEALQGWACFKPRGSAGGGRTLAQPKGLGRNAAKRKRKQARAAKKKNRRK